MKKPFILIVIFSILLINGGYAQNKKAAVVTFYVVKQIGLAGSGSAAATAAVARLANDPDFNMPLLLKNFHDQFFESYSKSFSPVHSAWVRLIFFW